MKSPRQISEPRQKMSVMSRAWRAQYTRMQRKCACGGTPGPTGECAECHKQRLSRMRQTRNSLLEARTNSLVPPIVNRVLGSSGQPLDRSTRSFMEPRFGHDFSRVRVHTNTSASESASAVDALAYTVGQDVVFAAGQYAPETSAGRTLLAHELAHVVQQQNLGYIAQQSLRIGSTDDCYEQEADRIAHSVTKVSAGPVPRCEPSLSPVNQGATKIQQRPSSMLLQRQVPTGIAIKEIKSFGHSDLVQEGDKKKFLTNIGAVTLMQLTPSGDYTAGQKKGECTKEFLTEVSNTCPAHDFCTGDKCLEVGRYGSSGDPPTRTSVTDGPDTFIDRHVTRMPTSFLEGSGKDKCSVVCHQRYKYRTEPDRQYHDLGSFYIIRNFRAGKYTEAGGTSPFNVTTGEIKKVPAGLEAPSKQKFAKDIAPGLASRGALLEPPPVPGP
jgi:hypothetical protein